jgi:hypothetical protein
VAIRQTGYRPNLQARRLRSRHTGIIGLIVADIRNPFFTALIRAVEEVAYREGLRVTLCNTDEDPEREALYLQLMHEERISGLIFAPTRTTVGRLERLTLDFPTVLVDRAAASGSIDSVVLDNPAAMAPWSSISSSVAIAASAACSAAPAPRRPSAATAILLRCARTDWSRITVKSSQRPRPPSQRSTNGWPALRVPTRWSPATACCSWVH